MNIKNLIGETLEYIDIDEDNNQILLTTKSGKRIMIYHGQDCCENVRIVDTIGNWNNLIGKVIIDTDEEIINSSDKDGYDSRTETNLTFKVDSDTVISKWIGESNGYYSENVDIQEFSVYELLKYFG
jgi:hypothetical protein